MSELDKRTVLSPATMALAAAADAEAMAAAVTVVIAGDMWAKHMDDPAFRAAFERSVRDNVGAVLRLFAGQASLADTQAPAGYALTDLLAEMAAPIADLERAYWIGSSCLWQEWFALAQRAAEAGKGSLGELVGPPTVLMFEYLVEVLRLVIARYEAVGGAIRSTRDDRRRALLAALIDGSMGESTAEAEAVLGYGLSGLHVGLALEAASRADAERAASHFVRTTGAQDSLLLMHAPSIWLLWLRYPPAPVGPLLDCVTAAAADCGSAVSIGDPAPCTTGFLQSRQDALQATAAAAGGAPRRECFAFATPTSKPCSCRTRREPAGSPPTNSANSPQTTTGSNGSEPRCWTG
ncbi:MAG: hypothetical protein ACT4QF_10780 [Sporichthyaceae bacterium]